MTEETVQMEAVDLKKVLHLSFESLIADTDQAFGQEDSSAAATLDQTRVTVDEFNAMLGQLYEEGYVLVRFSDLAAVNEDGAMEAKKLMLPSGKTVVYGGDRVFAVGLSKSIQKFIDYQDVGAKYTISTLKDFMGFGETERQSPLVCVEVKVTGKEPYCGKELKDTGIQSEEHCMIVGIKREDDTIMMPHATTVIRQGDVLWVMGAEMNVEHLEALSKE